MIDPEQLRQARVRAGLSQGDLAQRLDLSQPTVSTWESGTSTPKPANLTALNRILDIGAEGDTEDESDPEAPSSSPYGEWLARTRTAKGLTRRELAEQSGVSEPQIWNIETGQTLNPRGQTRERLAQPLGEAAPEETIQITEDDAEIPDVGTLTDFDPHDRDDLPVESGVYVFYDISERPIYVGESDNIRRRLSTDHLEKFWYKSPIVEKAAYVRITDQRLRRQVEATMIRFLKSNAVINRQNVRRASD